MDLRQPLTDLVFRPDDAQALSQWERERSHAFPPLRMVSSETPFGARSGTMGRLTSG
jgi:hypothetical protein